MLFPDMSSKKDKKVVDAFKSSLVSSWHIFCFIFSEREKLWMSLGEFDEKISVATARFCLYVLCYTDCQDRYALLAKSNF